jgi:D-alanyl-D-alanine dipeptidase
MDLLKALIISIMTAGCIPVIYGKDLDDHMKNAGMVDVYEMDSTIMVNLMYSHPDNFTGVVLYNNLNRAYLHPVAAKALVKASEELRRLHPGYRLLIRDAARPMSTQRRMYEVVQGTPQAPYVSNPKNGGGLHNYGLAVDITIADECGNELPMGTPVDHLGKEANIDREEFLVKSGVISETERQNRLLLRRVMKFAGFTPLKSEWWHFNFVSRATAKAKYKRLDF